MNDDAKSVETRERYVAHVRKMFAFLGESQEGAQSAAATVLRIETALARASLTRVEKRDPYKSYHRETLATLQKMASAFDWRRYFAAAGVTTRPWLNVSEPAFVNELNARLKGEA